MCAVCVCVCVCVWLRIIVCCVCIYRPVHLRRNVGFLTVITVPTVITPYSTVQITVGQIYGVRLYKTVPTLDSDRNLAIWLNFSPKHLFSFYNNCL